MGSSTKTKKRQKASVTPAFPKAVVSGTIDLGDFTFDCYLLSNAKRVLARRDVLRALDVDHGPPFWMPDGKSLVGGLLGEGTAFTNTEGDIVLGWNIHEVLAVCSVVVTQYLNGDLPKDRIGMARAALLVVAGLAHVGLVQLVDEANGVLGLAPRGALETTLRAYLRAEAEHVAKNAR
jgi:hypothetical protein